MKPGNTIKRLREQKGMNLQQMSKATGIQLATLSRMENNKMVGSLKTYVSIAKGLGLTLSQLFAAVEIDGGVIE